MKARRILAAALFAVPACASAGWMAVDDPLAADIRPHDGASVEQTPPDFSWPEVAPDARYTLNLTYPDGRTRSAPAPQNYANWSEVLAPGAYSWTVTVTDAKGTRTSKPRKFVVDANAKPFLAPDMNALLAKVKAKPHPRGLPDAATLAQMAKQRPEGIAKLRAELANRARMPVQPMPNSPSPGKDGGQVYDEVKTTQNALSAYALLKEDRYFDEALRRAKNMASWDPNGPTAYTRHGMNMSARTMTFTLALAYDWLHPKLDPATKELFLQSIKTRLGHMYADALGERSRIAKRPRDSHGQLTATMVGMISALVAGDIPEADAWAAKALPLALNVTQPWGGEDSGFSNGLAYALWDTGDLQPHWYILRWATGLDFGQKAWVRNWSRVLAYFNPPGTPARLFGDGAEQAMLTEQSARFGKGYTYFAPSPLGRWYASRLSGEAPRFEYLMSPPADFSGAQPLPAGTPNAIHLPTTGWVAMHSSLDDEKRVSVYFKSSPPPHGAFGHQHADQNAFVVNAGGQRLAIESGYYDGYKSPHWWNWLKATRSKNAITYDGGKGQIYFEATGYKKMGYGRITRFETTRDHDIVSGDATAAYDGALTQALRSIVYVRPNLIVVHDRVASATPRRWEWNIHALHKMDVLSEKKIRIQNQAQTLCVQLLAGPPAQFTQASEWVAEPTQGDGKLHTSVAPSRGEPQWHGRFATEPLPAAEFIALLDVGCKGNGSARRDRDGLRVDAPGRTIVLPD